MTNRWNVCNRFGEMSEFYFLLLQNDPYEKHWRYDMNGNKTYTMLKKNNPFMEGFRKWKLYDPKEAASSSGEAQWKPSLGGVGGAVMSLTDYQIADDKVRQVCSTPRVSGRH